MICLNENCLDGMRRIGDKEVDHTITDPPYEAEAHGGQVRLKGGGSTPFGLSFLPLSDASREEYAKEMVRVTRGWLIVFCQVEAVAKWRAAVEAAGARYKRTCIWLKPNAMPQFSGDRPAQGYETFVCAWCSDSRSAWNGRGKIGVYEHPIPRRKKRFHETQKPFSLMQEIVYDFTKPGELILDPFAGSGTTLLAAKKLGRRYLGFEQEKRYSDLANMLLQDPYYLPATKDEKQKQLAFL